MNNRHRLAAVFMTAALLAGSEVMAQGPTVMGSVYGGGALANTGDTHVNLTGGIIVGNVYGGGMGDADTEATVGSTEVKLNENVENTSKGCVVGGDIFGCNNINGTPRGAATVHIYKTQYKTATQIANTGTGEGDVTTAKVKGRYDVRAVYGGGNLAAYEPDATKSSGTNAEKEVSKPAATVIIEGCELTSIQTVYGGGNAASTPATNVIVNGTYEIEEVFGGGNGKDALSDGRPNPGANVGYKNYTVYTGEGAEAVASDDLAYDTKEERTAEGSAIVYGSGAANVNIYGGTIHRVFGGSNTKGNVRQTAVTMLEEQQEDGEAVCQFKVDEAYGGGKSAPMDAEAKLLMACIPGLEEAYGGAEAADIQGDVSLTITNGTFNRVFGGNNISGTIGGAIKVNIEEVGCKPIIIGELYGGGNKAGYSVYGYKQVTEGDEKVWKPRESDTDDGSGPSTPYADPEVNVKSFTSIGNIFGGGYGSGAVMVGNPTVNINVAVGSPDTYPTTGDYGPDGFRGKTLTVGSDEDSHEVTLPAHKKGEIGAIQNVFGGGNAAKVIGSTSINIGTQNGLEEYVEISVKAGTSLATLNCYTRSDDGTYTSATGTAAADETYYKKLEVKGADIRGNVYGGGNNAEVTGNTNVVIGRKSE